MTAPCYFLPSKKEGFRHLTPGEAWYTRNLHAGNKKPRGKVVARGKKQFNSRQWAETGVVREFLPARGIKT